MYEIIVFLCVYFCALHLYYMFMCAGAFMCVLVHDKDTQCGYFFLFTIFIIYFIAFHFNFFHTGLTDPEASWVGNPSCPVIPNDHSVCLPRIGAAGCTTTPTILHEFWTPEFKSSCLYYNYFANWAISSAFYFLLVCEYCME